MGCNLPHFGQSELELVHRAEPISGIGRVSALHLQDVLKLPELILYSQGHLFLQVTLGDVLGLSKEAALVEDVHLSRCLYIVVALHDHAFIVDVVVDLIGPWSAPTTLVAKVVSIPVLTLLLVMQHINVASSLLDGLFSIPILLLYVGIESRVAEIGLTADAEVNSSVIIGLTSAFALRLIAYLLRGSVAIWLLMVDVHHLNFRVLVLVVRV